MRELSLQRYYGNVYYVMRALLGHSLVEFRKINEARLVALFEALGALPRPIVEDPVAALTEANARERALEDEAMAESMTLLPRV
jgi:hypothetical protein